MKLLAFDEGKEVNESDEFVALNIEIYDANELIYFHDKISPISLINNPFNFLINNLKFGDSAHFMVETQKMIDLFKPLKLKESKKEYLSVFVKLDKVVGKMNDVEMLEQQLLKSYLQRNQLKPYKGIYLKTINEGIGEHVKVGDEITIAYKGCFLNGLEFDKIYGKTAFTFRYGAQHQVIKGLEIAIKTMREGQKSKIIIPSQLAFGEEGSTTLIVPPYTSLVYDLEIVKVN
ncbi:MAG: FKBP-type peptidyl-prolyl cis-trans isomerase [Vicingaceae bacterium]